MIVLSRRLKLGIGLAVAVVLGMVALLVHRMSSEALMHSQELGNVEIARTVANVTLSRHAAILIHPAGASASELASRPEVTRLHAELREALRGTNVVKVKVYALSGMTVYASDPKQIGENKRDNLGFQRALLGESPSYLTHRDKMDAFEGIVSNIEVVATYVPYVGAGKDAPAAVFEIYTDVSAAMAAAGRREWVVLAAFGAAVVALCLLGLGLVRSVGEANRMVEREAGERRVKHQAYHDAMTGLPNRANFLEHLAEAVSRAHRNSAKLAVFVVDIDRFKLINDSFGHKLGDRLLRRVARRIKAVLPRDERLFRIGGDEFGFVLTGDNPARDAAELSQRILAAVTGNFQINDRAVSVALSIGVTVFPDDCREGTADSAALVRNADAAMYSAKSEGGNRVAFFTPKMSERAGRQLELESGLRRALKEGEFDLYYQPRYHAQDRRIVGVEALLRWRGADGKAIQPDEFVPVLEDTGLVVPVGRWVLQQAVKQAQQWQRKGIGQVRVSVNVSPRQFHSEDFVESVRAALRATDLAPQWLELELTERLLCEDTEQAVSKMQALKRLGVVLSIDDFGTGYSSLSYLQRFPIDFLKIDKSFVRGIAKSKREAAIALAIIDMAHNLQIGLVAEGVEHEEQAVILRDRGCLELQGFLFSRPLAAAQVEHRLIATNGRDADASPAALATKAIAAASERAAHRVPPAAFMPTEFPETTQ